MLNRGHELVGVARDRMASDWGAADALSSGSATVPTAASVPEPSPTNVKPAVRVTTRTHFVALASAATLPEVDPRDTLATWVGGKRLNDAVFWLSYKSTVGVAVLVALAAVGAVGTVLGFYDSARTWGFLAAAAWPANVSTTLLLNRAVLRALLRSMDWWILFGLWLIALVCFIDMTGGDAPWIFAVVTLQVSLAGISLSDARPFAKSRASPGSRRSMTEFRIARTRCTLGRLAYVLVFSLSLFGIGAVLFAYYAGKMGRANNRSFDLGYGIELQTVQLGFSAFQIFVFINARFVVILLRSSSHKNELLLLRGSTWYATLGSNTTATTTTKSPASPPSTLVSVGALP